MAAESRGRFLAEDIRKDCRDGKAQLFLARQERDIRCVLVTRIVEFPQKRVCQIEICTGEDVGAWLSFLPLIESWAKGEGCRAMWNVARKGWARLLPDYDQTHVVLEKEL